MDTIGGRARGSVDTGQLLLVSLCLMGLVVAAFLAPVSAQVNLLDGNATGPGGGSGGGTSTAAESTEQPGSGGPGGSDGKPGPGTGPGTGGGEPIDGGGGDSRVLNGTRPVPIPGDEAPPIDGCGVLVEDRPVPGREVTVRVFQDLRPVSDTRVWFNDEFVGRTNATGSITARVPYERRLNVTVDSPANEPCEFYRRPYEGDRTRRVGGGQSPDIGSVTAGATAGLTGDRLYTVSEPFRQTQSDGGNSTGEYEVYGTATVRIEGRPYPGSTVVVNASIDGVPMRRANVTVDGQRVGRTNESGTYALTVPDSDTVTVAVTRGEYSGGVTVDVLQLSLQYTSDDPFVVPGERAEVTARLADEPARNATVRLDGRRLGTADANGTVGFRAPAQLSGSVTATTEYQTERVPIYGAFAGTILATVALLALSVLTTGATARYRGRATAKRVALGWTAVGGLFVAFAVWEWPGAAAVGALLALVALYRLRSALRSGAATTGSLLAGLVDALRRAVVHVVGGIERFADWTARGVRRFVAWLGTLPRSLSGLARRLAGWLRGLPAGVVAFLSRFSARRVAAAVAVVALLVGSAQFGGVYGFLGAAALVTLGLLAWWYRNRSPEESDTGGSEQVGSTVSSPAPQTTEATPSLRQLWRRLAKWVLPDAWRTSTPTEITQAAVDRGLPREPVESLADAFRDVEYGGEASLGYREQARAAFEALREAREEKR